MKPNRYFTLVGIFGTLCVTPLLAQDHATPQTAPFNEGAFSAAKAAQAAKAVPPVEKAQLAIEPAPNGKMKLTITDPKPLASDEVYVLESSLDLKTWWPYRMFISTTQLVVPKRAASEFFQVVKRKLPKGTATGKILVDNYQPGQWTTKPNGTSEWIPERGSFYVRGNYSVPASELSAFPSPNALWPTPYNPKYASLEAGIVGSNAGNLIYPGKTSYPFESPQKYTSRADAQAYLNSVKVFVVPRFVAAP